MKAVICEIKDCTYDRKHRSYFIDLKSEALPNGNAFTMRVPCEQFKAMNGAKEFKVHKKVKACVFERSVCAIFNSEGLGFMFTNVPFEIGGR